METEELRRAAAWPAEMGLEWDWSTKKFDVFLSHKVGYPNPNPNPNPNPHPHPHR